jgi:hypothetical protein
MNSVNNKMYLAQFTLSISDVTGIIQTIAVVISLIYLAIQVKDSTKATKGATYQSIISAFAEIESRISQDEKVARIYRLGQKNFEKLNEDETTQFNLIIGSFFNFYENLYYQYRNKLLEEELWASWCRTMRKNLEEKGVGTWWNLKRHLFSKSFREYVESGKCPRNY